jgi:hypothetical protein
MNCKSYGFLLFESESDVPGRCSLLSRYRSGVDRLVCFGAEGRSAAASLVRAFVLPHQGVYVHASERSRSSNRQGQVLIQAPAEGASEALLTFLYVVEFALPPPHHHHAPNPPNRTPLGSILVIIVEFGGAGLRGPQPASVVRLKVLMASTCRK